MQVYFGKTKVTARENTQKRLFPAINQGNRKDKTVKYDHLNQLSDSFLSRSMSSKSKRKHGPLILHLYHFAPCPNAISFQKVQPNDTFAMSLPLYPSIHYIISCRSSVQHCAKLIDSLHSFSITPSPVAEECHEICFAHRIL